MLRKLRLLVVIGAAFIVAMGIGSRAEAIQFSPDSYISFGGHAGVDFETNFVFNINAEILCDGAFVCLGDYDPVNFFPGLPVTYNGFSYDPLVPADTVGLWSFSTDYVDAVTPYSVYSFDLTNISRYTEDPPVGQLPFAGLSVFGSGLANYRLVDGLAVYDILEPTPMYWSFSADTTTGLFAFSSTSTVPPAGNGGSDVPDGGSTAALLGSILIGFGIVRRRLSNK